MTFSLPGGWLAWVKLSTRLGAVLGGAGEAEGAGCGWRAERSALSTSCVQWILMGGNGPRAGANSWGVMARTSSAVLPRINSVARLATAMAVSQPKLWKVALSITFLPAWSLNLIQRRIMSPQAALPAAPTA